MPRRGHHQEKIIRALKQANSGVNGGESCREHGIRIEETYVRVKGKWRYLYRALDSTGATIDFLLSTNRDAEAARRFLTKALTGTNPSHPAAHQHRQARRLSAGDCATPSRRRSGGKPSAPAGAVPQVGS